VRGGVGHRGGWCTSDGENLDRRITRESMLEAALPCKGNRDRIEKKTGGFAW
jgi:hypothetical protein